MHNTCELLTVNEAAAILRLRPSTVRAWVLRRKIPYVKLGARVFIKRSDLESLLTASVVPAVARCDRAGASLQ